MDNPRTDSARGHDDTDLIENMEEAPGQGGTKGGNLQRDIGSRAEEQRTTGDTSGVTRARKKDKPEEANLPRRND
jgi:hypothetical protein